jgi:hypothetical protein
MADVKTYLNVPFAQKDMAKALGGRWDAALKKWYAPADKDIALFAQWQPAASLVESVATAASLPKAHAATAKASVANNATGVMTYAADKDFIAYNGDRPPWD